MYAFSRSQAASTGVTEQQCFRTSRKLPRQLNHLARIDFPHVQHLSAPERCLHDLAARQRFTHLPWTLGFSHDPSWVLLFQWPCGQRGSERHVDPLVQSAFRHLLFATLSNALANAVSNAVSMHFDRDRRRQFESTRKTKRGRRRNTLFCAR